MIRLLVLTAVTSALRANCSVNTAAMYRAVDFEVFGRVQGVFFRKMRIRTLKAGMVFLLLFGNTLRGFTCEFNTRRLSYSALEYELVDDFIAQYTKDQADKLGLRGWCKNTSRGTVQGHMEGPTDGVESMMNWLKTTGSPSSRIDKAEFKNEKEIDKFGYDNFGIVKD